MTDREIEILFRRLRLYDRLGRRSEGLIRSIQRVMRERYVNARTIEMARREGGQLAMDQRTRRTAPARHARAPLLPARPGDHRCDRPVRREGARQPRLFSQQAV